MSAFDRMCEHYGAELTVSELAAKVLEDVAALDALRAEVEGLRAQLGAAHAKGWEAGADDAEVMAGALFGEWRKRAEAAEAEVERLRVALLAAANWREGALAYDKDMGHQPRDFLDREEWESLEDHARAALKAGEEKQDG